jgi:hypothetical protein
MGELVMGELVMGELIIALDAPNHQKLGFFLYFSSLSCCASNLTVNFSTIIVGRAGEPVSVFNLDA